MIEGTSVPVPAAFLDYCERLQSACVTPGRPAAEQASVVPAARRDSWGLAFAQARGGPGKSRAPRTSTSGRGETDDAAAATAASLPDSAETWALLEKVNRDVQRLIRPAADAALHGRDDWSEAVMLNGRLYGDCEDYVLAKRRALLAAGVPSAALSILIVQTARGEAHTVLLVRLQERGEFALDSLSPRIIQSSKLPYQPLQRQVGGDPFRWRSVAWGQASLRDPASRPG